MSLSALGALHSNKYVQGISKYKSRNSTSVLILMYGTFLMNKVGTFNLKQNLCFLIDNTRFVSLKSSLTGKALRRLVESQGCAERFNACS